MADPAAGWYDDPEQPGQQRYWDGRTWTEHRHPSPTGPSGQSGPVMQMAGAPTPSRATVSLVLGILSLVLCGLFTGIPAIVMGRRATREIDASGGTLGGRGIAQGGFITGIIGTVLTTIPLLIVVFVFALGGIVSSQFEKSCDTLTATPDDGSAPLVSVSCD